MGRVPEEPASLELSGADTVPTTADRTGDGASDIVALLPPSDAEVGERHFGTRPSLFVMPFEAPADAEREQRLVRNLNDDVVAVLSKSSDIAVIGRSAREWNAASGRSVRSLGRELDARYAITGDVVKRDGRAGLSVHLLETATGSSVCSKTFLSNPSDERSVLIDQIAGTVATEVLRAEAERTLREDPERLSAESLTNRARHSFTAFNRRTYHEIESLARMAIDLKPSLPGAYGILAGAQAMKAHQAWTDQPEEDLDEAFSNGGRAVELSPGNPRMLFWWGHVHFFGGRTEDAIGILENAANGDPSYVPTHILLGAASILAKDHDKGIAKLQHALRLAPDHAQAFQAHLWLGIGHFEKDDIPAAQKAFLASVNHNVIKNPADSAAAFWAWYGAAAALSKLGRRTEADAILKRLRQHFADHDYTIMIEHAEDSFAPNLQKLKMMSALRSQSSLVDLNEEPSQKPISFRDMFKRRATAEH